ncbi:TPA: TRAP transporter substrate-binding protein, partial [Escherichia coli]|nr:TRAP transporter substrate-binding protein [Escherichia coli]
EFFEIDKKPFQDAVQPIYDNLKNKPQLYKLYQQIQSAKH